MPQQARVYLAGAGPGDPDLLTNKARRLNASVLTLTIEWALPRRKPGFHIPGLLFLLFAALPCVPACADAPTAERRQELQYLLEQDCGSCHGMRLTGGLGPALTTEALAGKSRELLIATIREGRTGTPMPPWKDLLADADISWLVDYMLKTKHTP